MEGIAVKVTSKHISFVRYKLIFFGDEIAFQLEPEQEDNSEGLLLLLSSFGLNQDEGNLVPCFDLAEMERRNTTLTRGDK